MHLALILFAAAPALLSERFESWRREIEQRGGQVIVARIETEPETNRFRIPAGAPQRVLLERYFAEGSFVEQFRRAQAMTVNHDGPSGRVHFILLNAARSSEHKDAEEAILAHEFGHAWLDTLGFRSLALQDEDPPCLAVQASDIVQHILIRRELEVRNIPFRDHWVQDLNAAIDALGKSTSSTLCDSLARVALWTDVRLGLSAEAWNRHAEFDAGFRRHFPQLVETVDELVTVLNAVDVTARERYLRALAYVRQRLAAALPSL